MYGVHLGMIRIGICLSNYNTAMITMVLYMLWVREKLENITWIVRSGKSNDRQYNGQKKKDTLTDNDPQNN